MIQMFLKAIEETRHDIIAAEGYSKIIDEGTI